MSTSKTWLPNEWDSNSGTLLDPNRGLREAISSARNAAEVVDTGAGHLIAALERIERECVCPAHQLAQRALNEHLARLVSRAQLAQIWEGEQDEE